jgi:flagellar motor component MotA
MLVIVGIIVIFSLVVGSFIMKGRLELRKQRAQQGV